MTVLWCPLSLASGCQQSTPLRDAGQAQRAGFSQPPAPFAPAAPLPSAKVKQTLP